MYLVESDWSRAEEGENVTAKYAKFTRGDDRPQMGGLPSAAEGREKGRALRAAGGEGKGERGLGGKSLKTAYSRLFTHHYAYAKTFFIGGTANGKQELRREFVKSLQRGAWSSQRDDPASKYRRIITDNNGS